MTGPEHYRKAERLVSRAEEADAEGALVMAQLATVHATLALTAATAMGVAIDGEPESGLPHADAEAWYAAAGTMAARRGDAG